MLEFERVLNNPVLQKHRSHLRIIVGGPGAWQISPEEADAFGISTVVLGEGEEVVSGLFSKAIKGEPLPPTLTAEPISNGFIPNIVNPARQGHVQITRGCGRGCQFCAPTMRRWINIPKETILDEVQVNLQGGIHKASLITDDGLRYGSTGLEANSDAVLGLFKSILSLEGMESAGIAHASFSNVVQAPKLISDLSELCGYTEKTPQLGPQMGLETGSPRLIAKYMIGKPKPRPPEDWPEIITEGIHILNDNHWYPCTTLIMGLPDENEDDALKTLELVDDLKGTKQWLFPLFFSAMGESVFKNQTSHNLAAMTKSHWDLFFRCLDHSITFSKTSLQWLVGGGNRVTKNITKRFIEQILAQADKHLAEVKSNPQLMVDSLRQIDLKSKSHTVKQFFSLIT